MLMRQQTINSLLGGRIGDAAGVPLEGMMRDEILALYGPGGVTGPKFDFDPSLRRVPDTRGLAVGATSDDTQLSDAVADALILAGRYDRELHVLRHLHALWHDVAGWGGTTKRSLYEIDGWYRATSTGFIAPPNFRGRKADEELWKQASPRKWDFPARPAPMSRGNGVAMKIAPLALFLARRYGSGIFASGKALDCVLDLGRITHEDPISSIAAYAVASVIGDLLLGVRDDDAWQNMRVRVKAAESKYRYLHHDNDRFSQALDHAWRLGYYDPEVLWTFGSEGRSDAMTTVPLALAIWYRHSRDHEPTAALLEAMGAGGDVDTVASMVGAMMGVMSDRADWWPETWTSILVDGGTLGRRLGADLHDVAARSKPPQGWDREELLGKLGYK